METVEVARELGIRLDVIWRLVRNKYFVPPATMIRHQFVWTRADVRRLKAAINKEQRDLKRQEAKRLREVKKARKKQ